MDYLIIVLVSAGSVICLTVIVLSVHWMCRRRSVQQQQASGDYGSGVGGGRFGGGDSMESAFSCTRPPAEPIPLHEMTAVVVVQPDQDTATALPLTASGKLDHRETIGGGDGKAEAPPPGG